MEAQRGGPPDKLGRDRAEAGRAAACAPRRDHRPAPREGAGATRPQEPHPRGATARSVTRGPRLRAARPAP